MSDSLEFDRYNIPYTPDFRTRADTLLYLSRNIVLGTVDHRGRAYLTAIVGFFRSNEIGLSMISWSPGDSRHSQYLQNTDTEVSIAVGQEYSDKNVLKLTGFMRPIRSEDLEAAVAFMNTGREWWDMPQRELAGFDPDDPSGPQVYRTVITRAAMPNSYVTANDRRVEGVSQIPVDELRGFEDRARVGSAWRDELIELGGYLIAQAYRPDR